VQTFSSGLIVADFSTCSPNTGTLGRANTLGRADCPSKKMFGRARQMLGQADPLLGRVTLIRRAEHRSHETVHFARPSITWLDRTHVPLGRGLSSLGRPRYCTHTMRGTDPASGSNQLALRLCTFGPTERYLCTQIPKKARLWADLGGHLRI
jgi:hypothetical protein